MGAPILLKKILVYSHYVGALHPTLCFHLKVLWHLTSEMKAPDPLRGFIQPMREAARSLARCGVAWRCLQALAPLLEHLVGSVPQRCCPARSLKSHDNFKACVCSESLALVICLVLHCLPVLFLLACPCHSGAQARAQLAAVRQAACWGMKPFFLKLFGVVDLSLWEESSCRPLTL